MTNMVMPAQNRTPVLNFADANLQKRMAAGSSQGNLTADEQASLSAQMAQFNSNLAAFQGGNSDLNRKELWAEATSISHSIYDLRHNDLGTMGPTNAKPGDEPHETYKDRMFDAWREQKQVGQNQLPTPSGAWAFLSSGMAV